MSRRLDVLKAMLAMIEAALPGADIKFGAAFPERIPANGLAILGEGSLTEIDVTLSPLTYQYQLRAPLELAAYASGVTTSSDALDTMMMAIGAGIQSNRTLGGLVDWLEAEPPSPDDLAQLGAKPAKGTILMLVSEFETANPLT